MEINKNFKLISSKPALVHHMILKNKEVNKVDLPDNLSIVDMNNYSLQEYFKVWNYVGEKWHWNGRIECGESKIEQDLKNPDHFMFEVKIDNETAGIIEYKNVEENYEIFYFGLIEKYIAHGLGGKLFDYTIAQIMERNPKRIWLHTCSLDSPRALPFYRKKGFETYKIERIIENWYEKV